MSTCAALRKRTRLVLFATMIGFMGTLVLVIVLISELMPFSVIEQQRSTDRSTPIGWVIFTIALMGGYARYRLGS